MPRDPSTGLFVSAKRQRALRKLISYHEAGHIVIARALGVEIADISMTPNAEAHAVAHVTTHSAFFAARSRDAGPDELAAAIETDLRISLSGRAAEKVRGYPERDLADDDDGDGATITSCGIKLAFLQSGVTLADEPQKIEIDMDDPIYRLALTIIERATAETLALARKHYPAIVRVAAALQREDDLSLENLDCLIAGRRG